MSKTYASHVIRETWRSTDKWLNIWQGKVGDRGSEDCPLCRLFVHYRCNGCPIAEAIGNIFCQCTPYFNFRRTAKLIGPYTVGWVHNEESRYYAEKEYRFIVDVALNMRLFGLDNEQEMGEQNV